MLNTQANTALDWMKIMILILMVCIMSCLLCRFLCLIVCIHSSHIPRLIAYNQSVSEFTSYNDLQSIKESSRYWSLAYALYLYSSLGLHHTRHLFITLQRILPGQQCKAGNTTNECERMHSLYIVMYAVSVAMSMLSLFFSLSLSLSILFIHHLSR